MKLNDNQFDEPEESEEGLVLCRYNGQPVVLYDMGPYSAYVENLTMEYSKYCHPYLNLVYGYKDHSKGNLIIVREHVFGKNYYTLDTYEHLGDRLIGFYKCLTLIEYIHSFKGFLRVIRPEKFILAGGLTTVKLVDVIKNDEAYFNRIRSKKEIEKGARFIHPEFLIPNGDLDSMENDTEYTNCKRADFWSVGCLLYYAITKKVPWENCKTLDEVIEQYSKNQKPEFLKEEDIIGIDGKVDIQLLDYLNKCFENKWGDELTTFRESLEKNIENIKKYISDDGGELEMDYEKGIYYYFNSSDNG
jgi:serine/threonine protein kinase